MAVAPLSLANFIAVRVRLLYLGKLIPKKTSSFPTLGQAIQLKATAVAIPGESPETGSSTVSADNWIQVSPASSAAAEGVYTITLPTAKDNATYTTTLTFTSTATGAKTTVNVKLKEASPSI